MSVESLLLPTIPLADRPIPPTVAVNVASPLIGYRYRVGEPYHVRGPVERWFATDEATDPHTPVRLLREPVAPPTPNGTLAWPSLAWEDWVRCRARHLGLPDIVDRFSAGGYDYLVLEDPAGTPLWDAWDNATHSAADRYDWLTKVADILRVLHLAGAALESLRPGDVRITATGQAVLLDTGSFLPLPIPSEAPIAVGPSTPPELIADGPNSDARAGLYSFGALMLALELGRELNELDMETPDTLRPFLERCPDAHPVLGRLLAKTLCRDRWRRFPTADTAEIDPTGFVELVGALEACQRVLGRVRLDAAAWTSTGMVRGGNEDAFAFVHSVEAGKDDLDEYMLVLLADGMGGNEAGEVAAALTVQSLRRSLLLQPPFATLLEGQGLPDGTDTETIASRLWSALHEANRHVYLAAKEGTVGRRGMGCTAEAVYLDGRQLLVGHVGDSRTYLLSRGNLLQVTRDHTFVARLIELGQISEEEAESHPRRSELQQAIGGRADVEPELFHAMLSPGDWVLVCSDGLTAQLKPAVIQEILERAPSAESAARRLVNRANLHGAQDNVTVVVVRAV